MTKERNMNVIESEFMVEKVLKRMCRSKRKRIKKKWLKNPKNYFTRPSKDVTVIKGRIIVCHPSIAAFVRDELEKRGMLDHGSGYAYGGPLDMANRRHGISIYNPTA